MTTYTSQVVARHCPKRFHKPMDGPLQGTWSSGSPNDFQYRSINQASSSKSTSFNLRVWLKRLRMVLPTTRLHRGRSVIIRSQSKCSIFHATVRSSQLHMDTLCMRLLRSLSREERKGVMVHPCHYGDFIPY